MNEPYIPLRDMSGKLISELSTYEIERRLSILRRNNDGHAITVQYKRAYEAMLRERARARHE